GSSATVTLSLSGSALTGGATVLLSSSDNVAFPVPSSSIIPAGQSTTTFQVKAVSLGATVTATVQAVYNSSVQSASVIISPVPRNVAKPGIFRSGFLWLLDVDGNRQFNSPPDGVYAFGGVAGDIPIVGDWNGSGTVKVGIYRPSNGFFLLDI